MHKSFQGSLTWNNSPDKKRIKSGRISPRELFGFIKEEKCNNDVNTQLKEVMFKRSSVCWKPPLKTASEGSVFLNKTSYSLPVSNYEHSDKTLQFYSQPNMKFDSCTDKEINVTSNIGVENIYCENMHQAELNKNKEDNTKLNRSIYTQETDKFEEEGLEGNPDSEQLDSIESLDNFDIIDCAKDIQSKTETFHSTSDFEKANSKDEEPYLTNLVHNELPNTVYKNSVITENILRKTDSPKKVESIKTNNDVEEIELPEEEVGNLSETEGESSLHYQHKEDCDGLSYNTLKGLPVSTEMIKENTSSDCHETGTDKYSKENYVIQPKEQKAYKFNESQLTDGEQLSLLQKSPVVNKNEISLSDCQDPFDNALTNSQFLSLEKEISDKEEFTKPQQSVYHLETINKKVASFEKEFECQKNMLRRVINEVDELNKVVTNATNTIRRLKPVNRK